MSNDTTSPHLTYHALAVLSMHSSIRTRFYSGGMKFRLQYHRCPHCRQTSLYIAHHPLTIQCHVHSIDVRPHYPHHF